MKDLGYMNGWEGTPEIVVKCEELGHKPWRKKIGNCLNEYGCDTCGYKYRVDSSD